MQKNEINSWVSEHDMPTMPKKSFKFINTLWSYFVMSAEEKISLYHCTYAYDGSQLKNSYVRIFKKINENLHVSESNKHLPIS